MTRSQALIAALALLSASGAVAQQPVPRVIGPGGAGAQPQVGAGVYQGGTTAPAARGVNPFASAPVLPTIPQGLRIGPRAGAAPVPFVPPPAPGAPNNPAVFNPGQPQPLPVLLPPPMQGVNGVTYNPLFVSRRGVVSAYYVPPLAVRSPSHAAYPGEDAVLPATDPTQGFVPPSGEYHFLPWIW